MNAHAAFLLHQSVERYFHAVLLVFTGYKPKTHDIERLADETAPMHEALKAAMPRSEPDDEQRFNLLKRAYIEARYSKSYRITLEELSVLREHISDLAKRVRKACKEKLATFLGQEAVSELPEPPKEADIEGLPEPPSLDEPEAMERWRKAIVELREERGREEGRMEGRQEGRIEGRQEGLREGETIGEERGRMEGHRHLITRLLETRFGPLPEDKMFRLQSGTAEELDAWAERLLTAASLDEVFRG
jgi:HEPN domain-containing protein